MALPKIDVPIHEMKLISNGKTIRFRPFTVKEEKLFLMANEGGDLESIIGAIKQVVNNCIVDDIDISTLPVFDIENIFLNLRARSVGEQISLKYRCNNDVTDAEGTHKCGNLVPIEFNLLEVELPKMPKDNGKIMITDKLGIMMKYPSLSLLETYSEVTTIEAVLDLAIGCIDFIYDGEQIYYAKDSTKEELQEFVEGLQSKDLAKIKDFFDTMPKIETTLKFKCNKCSHEEDIKIEGIESFFV